MQRRAFLLGASALSLSACLHTPAGETVIYLVRHAEKQTGDDPALTPAGETRALALRDELRRAGITRIYSTDTKRTRATAAPIAAALGITVELYDGKALGDFSSTLKNQRGRMLVVGHSNTTPELVSLLGGEPGEPIVEAREFDRLYTLAITGDVTKTNLTRYGD
jgi:2,3-bisphosphoglycerate-dependent phosphoglycerate mutase